VKLHGLPHVMAAALVGTSSAALREASGKALDELKGALRSAS
jgi:hypothetical protein